MPKNYLNQPIFHGVIQTITPAQFFLRHGVVLLADRTNGHAYGMMLCPSVCLSSVTLCIVAKRYVVEGRRWYRWIGRW